MTDDFETDFVIGALKIFVNHILYVREVYPDDIFRRKKMYNCRVHMSICPNLNDYLDKVLNIARILRADKQLNKVEVLIYRDQRCVYETYAFDISNETYIDQENKEQYLIEFQEQLKGTLSALSERVRSFAKLPTDARLKLQLHTKPSAYTRICHEKCQEIPLLQVKMTNTEKSKELLNFF